MEEEYAVMEGNAQDDKATKDLLEQALVTNKQLLDVSEAKANSLKMKLEVAKRRSKVLRMFWKEWKVLLKF